MGAVFVEIFLPCGGVAHFFIKAPCLTLSRKDCLFSAQLRCLFLESLYRHSSVAALSAVFDYGYAAYMVLAVSAVHSSHSHRLSLLLYEKVKAVFIGFVKLRLETLLLHKNLLSYELYFGQKLP